MVKLRVAVLPNGDMQFIFHDALTSLMAQGEPVVTRASDVEPNDKGEWIADMGRVSGPALPPEKFRKDALAAEVAWLEENFIGKEKGILDGPTIS